MLLETEMAVIFLVIKWCIKELKSLNRDILDKIFTTVIYTYYNICQFKWKILSNQTLEGSYIYTAANDII